MSMGDGYCEVMLKSITTGSPVEFIGSENSVHYFKILKLVYVTLETS